MVGWRRQFLEERAEAVLLATGQLGWMSTRGVARILAWARPVVTVRRCTLVRKARWAPAALPGRSRITLPEGLPPWESWRQTLHELGHAFMHVGLGGLVDTMSPEERRRFPLATGAERLEEQLADDFVLALRLPARLLLPEAAPLRPDLRVPQLARELNVPARWVRRRLDQLEEGYPVLHYLPRWCAARELSLEAHTDGLRVLDRDRPLLRVPADRRGSRVREQRLQADLFALRRREFLAKYEAFLLPYDAAPPRSRRLAVLPVEPASVWAWAEARARRDQTRWKGDDDAGAMD